jgi:hypothetical protein
MDELNTAPAADSQSVNWIGDDPVELDWIEDDAAAPRLTEIIASVRDERLRVARYIEFFAATCSPARFTDQEEFKPHAESVVALVGFAQDVLRFVAKKIREDKMPTEVLGVEK